MPKSLSLAKSLTSSAEIIFCSISSSSVLSKYSLSAFPRISEMLSSDILAMSSYAVLAERKRLFASSNSAQDSTDPFPARFTNSSATPKNSILPTPCLYKSLSHSFVQSKSPQTSDFRVKGAPLRIKSLPPRVTAYSLAACKILSSSSLFRFFLSITVYPTRYDRA